MSEIKRLPDSEFEIMEIIWGEEPPITTLQIMKKLESSKQIKMQTLLTMLIRLIEKGFLTSDRVGRDRNYTPVISKQDYMSVEIKSFASRHYINSVGNLVKAFYDGLELSPEDEKELTTWLMDRGLNE
jgi:predicted transcriptional regulator